MHSSYFKGCTHFALWLEVLHSLNSICTLITNSTPKECTQFGTPHSFCTSSFRFHFLQWIVIKTSEWWPYVATDFIAHSISYSYCYFWDHVIFAIWQQVLSDFNKLQQILFFPQDDSRSSFTVAARELLLLSERSGALRSSNASEPISFNSPSLLRELITPWLLLTKIVLLISTPNPTSKKVSLFCTIWW